MWHLRDLRLFVAVADNESFTRAAEEVRLAQPALSKRIAALERELGTALFLRGWDGATLTEAGRTFLPYARDLVSRALEADAALHNPADLGLSVGFWYAPGGRTLSKAIDLVTSQRPGTRVAIRRVDWTAEFIGVIDRIVDVGVAWGLSPDRSYSGIVTAKLDTAQPVITMLATHPLASRTQLAPEDLSGQTLLVAPRTTPETLLHEWLGPLQIATRDVRTVDEGVEYVRAGLGIGMMPNTMMADYVGRNDFVSVPLRDAEVDLTAIWNPATSSAALIEEFVVNYRKAVQSERDELPSVG